MTSSATETSAPVATGVVVTEDALIVDLSDGRTLSVRLHWYPCLLRATPEERSNWRLGARGGGLHWPDVDEDASVAGLLAGRSSGESAQALERWLAARKA